jgi:hypothetical protein
MTREQLEKTLKEFPGVDADTVDVVGNGKLVAKMVVRTFNEVDEADRQEQVYAFLRERFPEDEMQSVEFILTNAPDDAAP